MPKQNNLEKYKPWIISGICVLTFLCFVNSLHNQFTNWDDDFNITINSYIKALTWHNLKMMFTWDFYPPLASLSFAINYYFSQLSPMPYYLVNILLHVANTALVFLLAGALFSKLESVNKNAILFISSLSALWFGIHPMHVESVSWVSERKDVLYTFFYLLGLLSYLKYISILKSQYSFLNKWYLITALLFILSYLSKPMAIVFPLSLFCMDILLKRKWDKSIIIEKIPLIVIAAIFSYISYHYGQSSHTITAFGNIPIVKRVLFATYGFVMYIYKFFVPFNLSTFYPYPCINMELHVDMPLPAFYYLSFFIALFIIAVPLYITYKVNNNYFRVVIFGIGFFLVNLLLVLQFISEGMAIMADRYSYVSYIGIFFMVTFFLYEIIQHYPALKVHVIAVIAAYSLTITVLCAKRTNVWLTAESLFKDAVMQYHDEASIFYKGLGDYYQDHKQPDSALHYYAKYARLNNDAEVFNDMGNLYKSIKDYPDAAKYYSKLLHAGSPVPTTLVKVSDAWAMMGQEDSAVIYYKKALAIDTNEEKLYANIASAYMNMKQYVNSINHYNVLIDANKGNPYYYFYRGVAKFSAGMLKESLDDFAMPVKSESGHNEVAPTAAYNMSVIYDKLGDATDAYKYAVIAKSTGASIDSAFFNSLEMKMRASAHNKK